MKLWRGVVGRVLGSALLLALGCGCHLDSLFGGGSGSPARTDPPGGPGGGGGPGGPAPAVRLAFVVQPATSSAGSPIAPAIQVAAQDSLGNLVTSWGGVVTLALEGGASGAVLSGTLSQTAVGGIASFADLSITKTGTGYILHAAASGQAPAVSVPFAIVTGPASGLAFTVQPSNAALLTAIAPPVRVTVFDASGNVATTFTGTVHVAIGHDPSLLGATLSGTTTVAVQGGVAVFGDLSIDQPGSGYTLTAALGSAAPAATSTAFNIGL